MQPSSPEHEDVHDFNSQLDTHVFGSCSPDRGPYYYVEERASTATPFMTEGDAPDASSSFE
ncbi:hypothetical protein GGP91_003215 [Salinibacter ruber]|nr:hypothetical protein [Salinibacter ruber]